MVTKEEFNKVWNESTTEDILNQFYYEHNDVRELLKENGNKEEVIKRQQKVIDQLTNNWNELEEWLDKIAKITANIDEKMTCKNVLDKMKEIKEGNNEFR